MSKRSIRWSVIGSIAVLALAAGCGSSGKKTGPGDAAGDGSKAGDAGAKLDGAGADLVVRLDTGAGGTDGRTGTGDGAIPDVPIGDRPAGDLPVARPDSAPDLPGLADGLTPQYGDGSAIDTTPGCVAAGASCTSGEICCSGICDTSTGKCAASVALCFDPGFPCQFPTDCCNLACVNGRCATNVATCVADNAPCTTSTPCCSGLCGGGGTCQPLNVECKTAGNPCDDEAQCCSRLCNNGLCALSGSYCIQTGDVCYRSSDCCSGLCRKGDAGAAGTCEELSTTGAGGCAKDGTVCEDCTTCCSALCLPFGRTGVKICQPASGCRVTNNLCTKDKDCCGGDPNSGLPGAGNVTCQLADDVSPPLGVCRNPQGCNPQGGICGLKNSTLPACTNAREDCCDCQPPKWQCCKPDSIGVPRCYGGSTPDCPTGYTGQDPCCIPEGELCTFSAECCDGVPCVPGPDGKLRCMYKPDGGPACVPTGGVCTATSDCCAGLTCNITPGQPTGFCGKPPISPPDAGSPPVGDAGVPPGDAGVPPADAGVPPGDAGVPPADATLPDAPLPPADAGPDAAAPDAPVPPPVCALWGQTCNDSIACCDNVPCSGPGFTGLPCQPGQQGCTCYYIIP